MKRVSMRQLLLIGLVGAYFLSSTWYSWPFKGRVVDESGQPVAGAVVGIGWVLSFFNEEPLVFKESITNKNGDFEIPGWIRVTLWPMYRMVDSPYLYLAKQGYTPIRLTSRWISYDKDVTPTFNQPILIHKVDLKNYANEHRQIYYLSSGLCSDMKLLSKENLLSYSSAIKVEITKSSLALPKWNTNEYTKGTPCL